ncbi:hypothetical protein ACEPAI_3465 [Sanghuangporus weigelae]
METSLAFQHCQVCARVYMVLYEVYYLVCTATVGTRDCHIETERHLQDTMHSNPPNPVVPKKREELTITTRTPRTANPITWRMIGWYRPELHTPCPASTIQANLYLPRDANLETKQLQLLIQRRIWRYIRDIRYEGKAWLVTRTQQNPPAELMQFMICLGPYSTPTRHLNTDVRAILTLAGPRDEFRRITYRAAYIAPRAKMPLNDGNDIVMEY